MRTWWPKRNSFQFPTWSFITSCYVPKCIILTWSSFVPTWIVHICSRCCCAATSGKALTHWALFTFVHILPSESLNGILYIKQYFQIKITNNFQCVEYNTRIMEHSCLKMSYMYIGVGYTWWHHRCPGMFWNILVLRDATHDATLLVFWL